MMDRMCFAGLLVLPDQNLDATTVNALRGHYKK